VLSGAVEATVSADLYRRYYDGKKLAVLHINNEYGQSLKKVFLASLQQPGILELPYGDKDTDFRTYLTKIKDAGVQVVYIVGYNEMVHIFRQAGEQGLDVQWIGAAQIGNQSIVEKLGTTADGIVFPSWEMNLDEIRSGNQQFYSLFLKGSGNTPLDPFAANAVDALNLLDSIIGPKPLAGEEIKNSLYKISGFRGLTGKLSFDTNGDVQRKLAVRTIRNGKVVSLEQPSN
jgi:branched-chain amino acid transport system substrate-binding protein